ncbi:MAG: hypothetical protein Q9184_000045 [Pyrenodesmia sp. 2 TL-2023]
MLSSLPRAGQCLPPHKLSKPPTNRSSTNLLAAPKQTLEQPSPLISSDADSTDGYFTQAAPTSVERRPRRNTRSKIRSYIYGQNQGNDQGHSSEDDDGSPKSFATVVKRRLSRTDSSTVLQDSSLGASPASSTSRLFMAGPTGSDREEEATKKQIEEKVWTDMLAAQNHVSVPVDEEKHPDSVMTPIRRRSLYTPGIATRSPQDILRKPPLPTTVISQAERDHYYNPAMPESSPLSRFAHLRASNTGRSTPSELDYTHLGAMKLGTLRVTNGAASPVPQDPDRVPSPVPGSSLDTTSQEDFHTASEGGRSEEERLTARSSCSVDAALASGTLSADMMTPPLESVTGTVLPTYLDTFTYNHTPFASPKSCEPNSIDRSDPVLGPELPAVGNTIKRKPLPPSATSRRDDQVSSVAIDYVANPRCNVESDLDEAHSAQVGVTSVQSRGDSVDTSNFASPHMQNPSADVWRAFIHAAEDRHTDNGSREDAFLKLTGSHKFQQDDSDVYGMLQNRPTDYSNGRAFHHGDSGYNSNTSLESTGSAQMLCISSPHHISTRLADFHNDPASTNPDGDSSPGNREYVTTEAPIAASMPNSGMENGPATNTAWTGTSFRPEKQPLRSNPPLKSRPSPEKSRKLQKRRPKSQPPLQRMPLSADDISTNHEVSSVPTAIAHLHTERMKKPPPFDCAPILQHTSTDNLAIGSNPAASDTCFASLTQTTDDSVIKDKPSMFQKLASRARSRSRSRPREKQTLYQSDEETDKSDKSDIMRSPSWSEYGNKKKKERKAKEKAERELQKRSRRESSADRKQDTRSRSRSRFRPRSRAHSSQHEPISTLTDFGTVSESLGRGPYDIARSSLEAQHGTAGNGIQPHPINSHKPSVQSSEGMLENGDAQGRYRSRSIARPAVTKKQNMRIMDGIPTKPSRPHSMFVGADRPPVPALPVANWRALERGHGGATSMGPPPGSAQNPYEASPATSMLDLRPRCGPQRARNSSPPDEISSATADKAVSMEELIDKLLDASDAETKETILHQMRQQRRGPLGGSRDTCQLTASVAADTPKSLGAPLQAIQSRNQDPSLLRSANADRPPNTFSRTEDRSRPESMFADAPPMPPLPNAERLQQHEARKLVSKMEQSRTLIPPQRRAPEAPKPDLWAGCAIETEHKKANKQGGTDWEAHQEAWSQRRRSAGEALLSRQCPSTLLNGSDEADRDDASQKPTPQPIIHRAQTAGPQPSCLAQNESKAFHRPWVLPADQEISQSNLTGSSQPDSQVAAAAQAFERLAGRYEGGLEFGYEAGFGLGGSAGTRAKKTGATRKSVYTSQGYGVDLSDVPIFVAPSK